MPLYEVKDCLIVAAHNTLICTSIANSTAALAALNSVANSVVAIRESMEATKQSQEETHVKLKELLAALLAWLDGQEKETKDRVQPRYR